MRKTAPLNSKPVRGRMLRFTSNEAQVSAGSYENNRTLETEGCGTQTSKPDVAECCASTGVKRKLPSIRYSTLRANTRMTGEKPHP